MVPFLNNLFSGITSDKGLLRVGGNELSERQTDTATLFSLGLKRGLGVEVKPSPENDPGNKVFDVQAVVDTVSGFIEKRIAERQAEGATQDELNDLISQAREGVARGFQLARDDIRSVGLLGEELSENIDAAEQGINTRIDQIEENLNPAEEGVVTSLSNTSFSDVRSFERSRASLQFQLTTQEGDRIRVSAQELFQRREQFSSLESEGNSISRFDSRTSYASAFSISVKGDLNDDELAALDELLVQVADISDSFFSGGVEDAFNQALALNFDSSQIAKFSLDLKSSSLTVVQQTEIRTSQQNSRLPEEYQAPQLPRGLQAMLTDYAERVEKLLESAKDLSSNLGLRESADEISKNLQRGFDQSVGRGNAQNKLFDALIEQLS